MSRMEEQDSNPTFVKAEDLKVVFNFAIDESADTENRTSQVRELIAQMLMLARKRGRPTKKEDEAYDIAA